MNREIKFRMWNDYDKKMIHWNELLEKNLANIFTIPSYNKWLMQYIGLHDKNGKEIYEGDILKGTFYGFPMPKYDYVFQIYWDEKEKGFMANYFEPSECEVIGNIYDNPELLGGE